MTVEEATVLARGMQFVDRWGRTWLVLDGPRNFGGAIGEAVKVAEVWDYSDSLDPLTEPEGSWLPVREIQIGAQQMPPVARLLARRMKERV